MKRTGIDKTAYAAMILLLLFFMGVLYLKHSYAKTQNQAALGPPGAVDRDLMLVSNYQALKDSELGRELELFEYEAESLEEAVRRKISSVPAAPPAPVTRAETLRLTEHIVREGEGLRSVARTYNVSPTAIITVNNLSTATRALTVGQSVRVPNTDGIMVTVRAGESLGTLAQRYRLSTSRLMAFNRLGSVSIRAGQRLFIPGSNLQPATGTAPAAASEPPMVMAGRPLRGTGGFINPCPTASASSGFGWRIHPVYGTRKFHSGQDLSAPAYTPVRAAKEGRVQYAGWISGYGKTVVIEHDNGYTTYYAHMISLTVGTGSYVNQGQLIGRVGSTGIATGNHLHFEVRSSAGALDPAPYIGLSSYARAGAQPVRTPTVVQQGQPAPEPAGAPTGEENAATPSAPPAPQPYIDVEVVPVPTPSASPTVTGGGTQRGGPALSAPGSSG